jgi:tetratricopeptide (TPR) repeat protein
MNFKHLFIFFLLLTSSNFIFSQEICSCGEASIKEDQYCFKCKKKLHGNENAVEYFAGYESTQDINFLKNAIRLSPILFYKNLLKLDQLYNSGGINQAIPFLSTAIENDKQNELYYLYVRSTLRGLNFENDDVLRDLIQLVNLSPFLTLELNGEPSIYKYTMAHYLALNTLGKGFESLKEWNKALSYYSKGKELFPEQTTFFTLSAEVKETIKDYKGAIDEYSIASKLDSKNKNLIKSIERCKKMIKN